MSEDRVVLSLSGGLDSTSLALQFLADGFTVYPLVFDYGQRHRREIDAALSFCNYARAKVGDQIDAPVLVPIPIAKLLPGCSLTDNNVDVPEGHYEEESMKQTVVPNRNAIFLNMCAAAALARKIMYVGIGAHAGDHAIYPDCRLPFINKCEAAINEGNYGNVQILAPFIGSNKGQVLRRGLAACKKMGMMYEIVYARTWTCYNGRESACGKCGSCQERLEAFQFVQMIDPLQYE